MQIHFIYNKNNNGTIHYHCENHINISESSLKIDGNEMILLHNKLLLEPK